MAFNITAYILGKKSDEIGKAIDLISYLLGKASSGGGGTRILLFEETVRTEDTSQGFITGIIQYNQQLTADSIIVTFNGTEYTCQKQNIGNVICYGGIGENGPYFTEYPFAISSVDLSSFGSEGIENTLYTETEGTYTVKVETE